MQKFSCFEALAELVPVFRFLLPTGRRDNPQIRLPPPKETVLVTLFVVDSHMTPVWITGVEISITLINCLRRVAGDGGCHCCS
jgi:hypothetical protein